MRTIDPKTTSTRDLHQYIVGAIAPRPIAFVSTVDEEGNENVAPYSFFNAFSSNPPMLVFSSNRRVLDNTTKDTLSNVMATKEVVINVVNYAIVHQMAVASVQFDKGVSEFEKSGLTPIPSDLVKPPRVKESPVQFECKVTDIITLGEHGGAGHLILCEVLRIHIHENVLDEDRLNPHKLDLMGRMGRSYYVRASGDAIMTLVQSVETMVIGYDALPSHIKNSSVLTANNIGQLAGLTEKPNPLEVQHLKNNDPKVKAIMAHPNPTHELHTYIKDVLKIDEYRNFAGKLAWLIED